MRAQAPSPCYCLSSPLSVGERQDSPLLLSLLSPPPLPHRLPNPSQASVAGLDATQAGISAASVASIAFESEASVASGKITGAVAYVPPNLSNSKNPA